MTITELNIIDLKKREKAVRLEYPFMDEAFSKVREALVDKMFSSTIHNVEERERLYFAVQTLDAVKSAMSDMMGIGSDDIDKYVEEIQSSAATKGA